MATTSNRVIHTGKPSDGRAVRLNLPPLTLIGADVLRAGVLREGAVGLDGGCITDPIGPAIDISGHLVLPGVVDLGGDVPRDHRFDVALAEFAAQAAMAGTTTLFVGRQASDLSELAPFEAVAFDQGPDIKARVAVGTHDFGAGQALLERLEVDRPDAVSFTHPTGPERRAVEDQMGGFGRVARHLSGLATALDAAQIKYGSDGDSTAETREWMSMIGARMIFRPATRQAAATARAMGEPVILSATDILTGGEHGRGLAAALLGEGLCDALGSYGPPDAALRAVIALVRSGRMGLGHAWAQVSSAPAGIMGLSDRGGLVSGTRADIVLLEAETFRIAATISAGQLIYADAAILARFEPVFDPEELAAE